MAAVIIQLEEYRRKANTMAKFPEYTAPSLELRPTETGIDALQQAARRVGAFYGQAAEDYVGAGQKVGGAIQLATDAAVKWEANREVTAGAKNFARGASTNKPENDDPSIIEPIELGAAATG